MCDFKSIIQPFEVDLFCTGKKFLVYNMVGRNLKIKYRRSIAGFFWTILSPLAMTLVFYFIFKVILKIQVPYYLVFILSGMLPWAFFSQTIIENTECLVANWGLLSKVPIPIQVFPYVGTLTNLITLVLAIPILFGVTLLTGAPIGPSSVMIPLFLVFLFLLSYSLSIIFSVAYVYFRDLKHILGILMQLWFYATPVVYDESMIPEKYKWILFLNPLGMTFSAFHEILIHGTWPNGQHLGITFLWTLSLLLFAIWVRKTLCHEIVEQL